MYIEHYNLGTGYCRQTLRQGGVCILVHDTINYVNVNLNTCCKEQDLEVYAIKCQFPLGNIYILAIYRAPTGDFSYFLNGLEAILKSLCNLNSEFIFCGDFNVNYLDCSNRRKQLDALLSSFNLLGTVCFCTRILNDPVSAIDKIFVNFSRKGNYTISSLANGLSDHDGQLKHMKNINLQTSGSSVQLIRTFSKSSVHEFVIQLSYETWNDVFTDQDIDTIFNSFVNAYLRILYSN
jgi:hypothetical protein